MIRRAWQLCVVGLAVIGCAHPSLAFDYDYRTCIVCGAKSSRAEARAGRDDLYLYDTHSGAEIPVHACPRHPETIFTEVQYAAMQQRLVEAEVRWLVAHGKDPSRAEPLRQMHFTSHRRRRPGGVP